MLALLRLAARQGRVLLVLGLVAGFALPGVAAAMKPVLPPMVAFLVFVSALRIGLRAALGSLREARASLSATVQWNGYPGGRYAAVSLGELFLVRSGSARDLADFRERTSGLRTTNG